MEQLRNATGDIKIPIVRVYFVDVSNNRGIFIASVLLYWFCVLLYTLMLNRYLVNRFLREIH